MYILTFLLIMLMIYKWFEKIMFFLLQKSIEIYTWKIQPYFKIQEIEWSGPNYPIFVKLYGFTLEDKPEDLTESVKKVNEEFTLEEILDGPLNEVLNNLYSEKENPFLMISDVIWKWCEIHYTYNNKMYRIIFEDTIYWPPIVGNIKLVEKIIVADIENESVLENIQMYEGSQRNFHGKRSEWKKMLWDTKWAKSENELTIINNHGVIETYSLT